MALLTRILMLKWLLVVWLGITATEGIAGGIEATYYQDVRLENLVGKTTHDQIDFVWKAWQIDKPPLAGMKTDNFSAVYRTWLTVPQTGDYQLIIREDDRVMFYFNGQQLVYDWDAYSGKDEHITQPLHLQAGQRYPLELLYAQDIVDAELHLEIKDASGKRSLIPASYFSLPDATFPSQNLTYLNFTALDKNGDAPIYSDALGPNWWNWSWGGAYNLAYSVNKHSGQSAIQADLDGWSALCLYFNDKNGFHTHNFKQLSFWLHRGQSVGGQAIGVQLSDATTGWEWMHRYMVTVPTDNAWHEVVIPLQDIDGLDRAFTRLAIIGNGQNVEPILIDDMRFIHADPPVELKLDVTPAPTATTYWLFRDERNTGLWESYNADILYQGKQKTSGAFGLGARFSYYGYLAFTPLDAKWDARTTYPLQKANTLVFTINRGAADKAGQKYVVYAWDKDRKLTKQLPLDNYLSGGALDNNPATWQTATIPLSQLTTSDIYAVGIQEFSGVNGTTDFVYLDEVRFEYQPAQPPLSVYQSALPKTWANWSWGSTVNLNDVQSNNATISVKFNQAWAGLYLHTDQFIGANAGYNRLRFKVNGGSGGQILQLKLVDSQLTILSDSALDLVLKPGWQTLEIPLSRLGNPAQISGIIWQESKGTAQPVFYLDDIELLYSSTPIDVPMPDPVAGPALQLDMTTPTWPISEGIYGMNFATPEQAKALGVSVNRFGGNATTRYNWKLDVSNRALDWYFENIANTVADVTALPNGSSSDQFVAQDKANNEQSIITVPLIGWTPKSRDATCGFSTAKYGTQQSTDPWRSQCGNGKDANGKNITGNDPTDTSVAIQPSFVSDWVKYLSAKYGKASAGGVQYYSLDNEPMLWHATHRDVHPKPVGYDELRDVSYQYAAAVKAADASAKTLGPALWGWTAYWYSAIDAESGQWSNPPDRNAHGGTPLVPWYLQQMRTYEKQKGVRLLDYLDLHFYPQNGVALSSAGGRDKQDLRLRSTRALWDASYKDESWIGTEVQLIPRMRQWVNDNYPGTKLSLSEYNWGALDDLNGALTQADILGIFGREKLDLATLWDAPKVDQPGAFAFRMYRNYDGRGSRFGDQALKVSSANQEQLAVYAAQRSSDKMLTIMVINKSKLQYASTLNGLKAYTGGKVYRYSAADLSSIRQQANVAAGKTTLTANFPPESITLFELQLLADRDGDGVTDDQDAFPDNANEWLDTDHDGIGNNADTDDDGDGMPDVWELQYGLNPLSATDATLDKDGDGLSNSEEYKQGSNPTNADSDADGMKDKAEVDVKRNPAVNEAAVLQIIKGMF